jgi:hypothetical protein
MIFIEAVMDREKLREMAEMPFAKGGSGVSFFLQNIGDGFLFLTETFARCRPQRAGISDAIWVATGEETGAGGGTHGLRGVEASP